jgi:hypothetical protein
LSERESESDLRHDLASFFRHHARPLFGVKP